VQKTRFNEVIMFFYDLVVCNGERNELWEFHHCVSCKGFTPGVPLGRIRIDRRIEIRGGREHHKCQLSAGVESREHAYADSKNLAPGDILSTLSETTVAPGGAVQPATLRRVRNSRCRIDE
jgi:hypothetical protein